MDSLRPLVAKWRKRNESYGTDLLTQCADELEAVLTDTGTPTDEQIENEFCRRFANRPPDAVELAKWARDYRTPSVPTRDEVAGVVGYKPGHEDYDHYMDQCKECRLHVADAVLALYPNTDDVRLLGQVLGEILVKAGMVREAPMTGPELLMFAEQYRDSLSDPNTKAKP